MREKVRRLQQLRRPLIRSRLTFSLIFSIPH
jgi:hypothetical protein